MGELGGVRGGGAVVSRIRYQKISLRGRIHGGFSLLETLVALTVLSIGLLGLAALHLKSMRAGQEGFFHTLAIQQLNDMAERLRANATALANSTLDELTALSHPPQCAPACTAAQIIEQEFYEWNIQNKLLLPAGRGEVRLLDDHTYEIIVRWDNHRTGHPDSYLENYLRL